MVEEHLKGCVACQQDVEGWNVLRRRTATHFHERTAYATLPPDAWARLQAGIARPAWHPSWFWHPLLPPLSTIAITVVLVGVLGLGFTRLVAEQRGSVPATGMDRLPAQPSPLPSTSVPTTMPSATLTPGGVPVLPVLKELPPGTPTVLPREVAPVPTEAAPGTAPTESLPATAAPVPTVAEPMIRRQRFRSYPVLRRRQRCCLPRSHRQ